VLDAGGGVEDEVLRVVLPGTTRFEAYGDGFGIAPSKNPFSQPSEAGAVVFRGEGGLDDR